MFWTVMFSHCFKQSFFVTWVSRKSSINCMVIIMMFASIGVENIAFGARG